MNEIDFQQMRDCEDRHWWFVTLHELTLRFVAAERQARGTLRILDAGCGTGALLTGLQRFGEASGCDLSSHALRHCRERGLKRLARQNLNHLAVAPGSFDLITCMDVIEHEGVTSDAAVLEGLHRALKPGGLLLLNCTAFEHLRSTHDEAVRVARRYDPATLRRLIHDAGFQIERLTCRMFVLFVPLALYRLTRRLLHRKGDAPPASDVWLPHPALNAVLLFIGRLENLLQDLTPLPIGTSLFVAARKPR
jgi:SAM-dependent methyltransferase